MIRKLEWRPSKEQAAVRTALADYDEVPWEPKPHGASHQGDALIAIACYFGIRPHEITRITVEMKETETITASYRYN